MPNPQTLSIHYISPQTPLYGANALLPPQTTLFRKHASLSAPVAGMVATLVRQSADLATASTCSCSSKSVLQSVVCAVSAVPKAAPLRARHVAGRLASAMQRLPDEVGDALGL